MNIGVLASAWYLVPIILLAYIIGMHRCAYVVHMYVSTTCIIRCLLVQGMFGGATEGVETIFCLPLKIYPYIRVLTTCAFFTSYGLSLIHI